MVQRFWRNSCWVLFVGMLLGGGAALAIEDSIDLLQAADFDHFVFLLLSIVLYRLASMGVLNILVNRLRGLR